MNKNNKIFDILSKEFNSFKRDLIFPSDMLELLNEEQRKTIESKIIRLCKSGDNTSYKYIPYMKYFNPEIEITNDDLNKLPSYDKAEIFYNLYKRSFDLKYIHYIIKLSELDIKIFSYLTVIYMKQAVNNLHMDFLRSQLYRISNVVNDYRYVEILNKRLNNIENKGK